MNILQKARKNLFNGHFLTQEDLTQAQYDLVSNPNAEPEDIFRLHDELFGSNLVRIPKENIETGAYFPDFVPQPPTDWTDADVEEEAPLPACPV